MVSYLYTEQYLKCSKIFNSTHNPDIVIFIGVFVPFVIFIYMTKAEKKHKNKVKMSKTTRKMNQKRGIHKKKS